MSMFAGRPIYGDYGTPSDLTPREVTVMSLVLSTNLSLAAGSIGAWVNGSQALDSSNAFFPTAIADNTGKFIRFDFDVPVRLYGATSYQGPSAVETVTRGNWKWQIWNGTAFVDVGSPFLLGGAASQSHTQLAGNAAFSARYQLLGTGGPVSDSGWMSEILLTYENAAETPAYATPIPAAWGVRTSTEFFRKLGVNQQLPLDIYIDNNTSPAYRETIRSEVIHCQAGDILEIDQSWGTTNDSGGPSEMAGFIMLRRPFETGSYQFNNAGPGTNYRIASENDGTNIILAVHHHPLRWHGLIKVLVEDDYVVSAMHYTSWGNTPQSGSITLQDGDMTIKRYR